MPNTIGTLERRVAYFSHSQGLSTIIGSNSRYNNKSYYYSRVFFIKCNGDNNIRHSHKERLHIPISKRPSCYTRSYDRYHNWIYNYCGKTTLAQLLAILTKAQLLVGNDSGSMHLMAALQRPQIAVFGSTSPTWTGPINSNATVISRNLSCSPCFSRTCRFGHYECLTQIYPEDVFAEVQKHFSQAY